MKNLINDFNDILLCKGQQRGHLSAHASKGQCVEYANCEILAKLKIELSVNITKYQLINIMVI